MPEGGTIDRWWAEGERMLVRAGPRSSERRLFVHQDGDGPVVTFLHGFPTSSWDYAPLLAQVPSTVCRLCPDLLGFGDSDKPPRHEYSLVEQLDLVLDLWSQQGVDETWLVAHDYSVSIVQEALARIQEGSWRGPELRGITLLNGGLFYSRIEPKLIQDPPCPVRYVWGPLDPVSGAHMLEGVYEHVEQPDIVTLDGVSHYPQLEVPDRVAKHLLLPA